MLKIKKKNKYPVYTSQTCLIGGPRSDLNGKVVECEGRFKENRDIMDYMNLLKMKGLGILR